MKVKIDVVKKLNSMSRNMTLGLNLSTRCTKPSKKIYSRKNKWE
jgi:hypothetical protein